MRPRKPVVIWSENEVTESDLAFVLNNQVHVHAESVTMATFFQRVLTQRNALSVILIDTGNHPIIGVLNMFALRYGAPVMVLCRIEEAEVPTFTGAVTLAPYASNTQIIEQVRLLTARTPGPMPRRTLHCGGGE